MTAPNIKIKWLIWCHERQQWWKPSCCGYTYKIQDAGRYSFEEALRIVKSANIYMEDIPDESMVPEYE